MSDWTLPPTSILLAGMTGSGKTTFALRYLLNVNAACRFVFDDLGQVSKRLRIPHASTARELELALQSRWVVFNPHRMFEGDTAAAFRFFCDWTFNCARRGPGKKVLHVDEIWQWCSPSSIPIELARISQMGRSENLELLTATQRPHRLNDSLVGSCVEFVTFRLDERLAMARIVEMGHNPDQVRQLPMGSFLSFNRITGGRIAGRVF